ncbi:DNA repair protein RadC [Lapidilactobacillus mulanensis]|uniref:DNA repair protein RadC n=1 Tax=Lapidilactobacillus mulanensis TaxID=2485999 RepID=A0ABW4DSI6_9LACO|nr:DNA repair protein RadC [Lapidilactobacillus mulanensis]
MEQILQPMKDLPREVAFKYGIGAASDQELLQIILRTGTATQPLAEVAASLLREYENLAFLSLASIDELRTFAGIGSIKAVEMQAAFELGKRAQQQSQLRQGAIVSSSMIGLRMQEQLQGCHQEKLIVIYLDTKNQIIQQKTIFVGGLNSSVAHPREIFHYAVLLAAARLIVVHNHPSGKTTPSQNDIQFSKRLVKCGEVMGIECLDHLIIGAGQYLSLREEDLI